MGHSVSTLGQILDDDLNIFPVTRYEDVESFVTDYKRLWLQAINGIEPEALSLAIEYLHEAIMDGRTVYACGNGGSAAVANHMLCDFQKGIQTGTDLKPQIASLSANLELMMAIANDISYDDIFSFQLRTVAKKNDVLVAISSSGNSKNIIKAIEWAKDNGMIVIALTGFSGGKAKDLADVTLYVKAQNYGVVESAHHVLMHMMAQYIRHRHMSNNNIRKESF